MFFRNTSGNKCHFPFACYTNWVIKLCWIGILSFLCWFILSKRKEKLLLPISVTCFSPKHLLCTRNRLNQSGYIHMQFILLYFRRRRRKEDLTFSWLPISMVNKSEERLFHSTDKPCYSLLHVLTMSRRMVLRNFTRFKCSTSNNPNSSYLGLEGKKRIEHFLRTKHPWIIFFKRKHQTSGFVQKLLPSARHAASVGVSHKWNGGTGPF